MELVTIAKRNNPFTKLKGRLWRSKYLMLMILPAIVFYIIFCYIPMYGVVMAFKDFRPKLGIIRSPWNGVDNFISIILMTPRGTTNAATGRLTPSAMRRW